MLVTKLLVSLIWINCLWHGYSFIVKIHPLASHEVFSASNLASVLLTVCHMNSKKNLRFAALRREAVVSYCIVLFSSTSASQRSSNSLRLRSQIQHIHRVSFSLSSSSSPGPGGRRPDFRLNPLPEMSRSVQGGGGPSAGDPLPRQVFHLCR